MRILGPLVGLAFLALAAPIARAGDHDAEKSAARAAAESWLKLVDAGSYAGSWTTAASLFKSHVDQATWVQQVGAVRGPMGKLGSRAFTSATYATSLPGAPDGEYVVLQYQASFDHKASAVETITPMKDKDGAWRVSGYFIR
jgi:hypothetical protein